MVLVIVPEKKLLELFRKNSCKKQIKVSLELKNQSVEIVISYILDGKDKVICLIAAQIKKAQYNSVNSSKNLKYSEANVNVELDLSNYAAKAD